MIMDAELRPGVRRAILSMTFLTAVFLAAASGMELCDEADQSCEEVWSMGADAEIDVIPIFTFDMLEDRPAFDLNASSTETIAFNCINESSSAQVQSVATVNDTEKTFHLAASDVDMTLLSYNVVGLPEHGRINGSGPAFTYQPDQGYVGGDSVVIGVYNETGLMQNITIAIDIVSVYHPPSVRIRSPRDGEIFTADAGGIAMVPIRATATGDVAGIQLFDGLTPLDGIRSCESRAANCAVSYIAALRTGLHYLTAVATDSIENCCATDSIENCCAADSIENCCVSPHVAIIVNPAEPQVEITGPSAGQIFNAPADIIITANVKDSREVKSVEFFANGRSLGEALQTESPYSIDWTDVPPGVYRLVAKATDRFGSSYSESVMIVVVPPKPLRKSNLAITMSASPSPAPAGGLFNYVITLTNIGPDSATGVTVEDFLPDELKYVTQDASQGKYNKASGLWNVGGLAKYGSANLVITVKAPSQVPAGRIYNTAYVYGSQNDPDNSNNYATTYIQIKTRGAAEDGLNSSETEA